MEHHDVNAYTGFAEVYDLFMDNVPYDDWCRYLVRLLRDSGIRDGLVLDLGCGTGNITERLAKAGYDMIGVDASEDMLSCALKKRDSSGSDILYLQQDMRSFELYGTVRAVVSLCDSMNYILDYGDLVKVFRLVNNYLDPGGIFIFDCKTAHYFRKTADQVYADADGECREGTFSYIWEEEFDERRQENNTWLTLYLPEKSGLYRRYDEEHIQKVWEIPVIRKAAEEAGMTFVEAMDRSRGEVTDGTDRIYVILREKGKEKADE